MLYIFIFDIPEANVNKLCSFTISCISGYSFWKYIKKIFSRCTGASNNNYIIIKKFVCNNFFQISKSTATADEALGNVRKAY
jgi:hypothetical protein